MISLKVLFVGGEASPFSKTGGLGDVLGSLPKALVQEGIDARVVIPKHKITKDKFQINTGILQKKITLIL